MRAVRTALTCLGLAAAGYGAYGLVAHLGGRAFGGWLRFWLGSALAHDLLIAPLVLSAGWAMTRALPPLAKAPMQAGALITGILALVEAPFVTGAGRRTDVPSALPLNYGRGLLLTLGAVWLVILGVILGRLLRRRRVRRRRSLDEAIAGDR